MEAGKPTQWRTPDRVMRKIRLRKQQKQMRRSSLSIPRSNDIGEGLVETSSSTPVLKRQNPFARKRPASEATQAEKKRIISSEYGRDVVDVTSVDTPPSGRDDVFPDKVSVSTTFSSNTPESPFIYLEEDSIQGIFSEGKSETRDTEGAKELPVDWTIKRKARFLSKSPFSWCGRMKGAEEAASLIHAARCRESENPGEGETLEMLQRSWRIELGRCITYWQHPTIPWLSLFPRFGPQQKLTQGGAIALPNSDEVTKSLYDSWVISLRSAYQLVRERLCPFFYICSQQYTAIFRAATVSGSKDITCMVTPTTAGLRQSLQREGVKFTLPLQKNEQKPKSPTNADKICTENKENEDEKPDEKDDFDHEDDAKWDMISEGIQFHGARELRQTLHTDTSSRSVVLVEGNSNTQLLFNYLLNSKSSISSSGTQALLPPTILSPIAFQGASIQKLSLRSGIAKTFGESTLSRGQPSDSQHKFSLDISGPLLPHSIIGITELLRNTQRPNGFQAAFSSSMDTAPFNTAEPKEITLNPQNVEDNSKTLENVQITREKKCDFGLTGKCMSKLTSKDGETCCVCQAVLYSNDSYTWKL